MRKILVASAILVAATLSACSAPANHGQAVEAPKASVAASEAPKATPTTPAKAEAPKATTKASEAPKAQTVKAEAPKAVQQAPKAVEQANAHMATAPKEFAEAHKPYIPCSAVGMVANAKGVCQPPKAVKGHKSNATTTAPVQSVKGPVTSSTSTSYVPAITPDQMDSSAMAMVPVCNAPALGSGGAVSGAQIESRWKIDYMRNDTVGMTYKLCTNDPALSPNFDTMKYASDGPYNGVWILFTSPTN